MIDGARAKLAEARLYLVTDARGGGAGLADFLDAALGAGVDIVQLREKELEAKQVLELAAVFRDRCDAHRVPFIVNDRADVALAAGADGVHLGQDDLPLDTARRILGPDAIVGRSTHDAAQFRAALEEEADYVVAGPVWETPTKPGRPAAGIDLIRFAAAAESTRPWFAIGGIGLETIGEVRAAGASRVVVVRAITTAEDPAAAVKVLREELG
jgi:thiamine-phosphate pyrophosphorylase